MTIYGERCLARNRSLFDTDDVAYEKQKVITKMFTDFVVKTYLTPMLRATWDKIHVSGKTIEEVALEENVDYNTIKIRLHRIDDTMRTLAKNCFDNEMFDMLEEFAINLSELLEVEMISKKTKNCTRKYKLGIVS